MSTAAFPCIEEEDGAFDQVENPQDFALIDRPVSGGYRARPTDTGGREDSKVESAATANTRSDSQTSSSV